MNLRVESKALDSFASSSNSSRKRQGTTSSQSEKPPKIPKLSTNSHLQATGPKTGPRPKKFPTKINYHKNKEANMNAFAAGKNGQNLPALSNHGKKAKTAAAAARKTAATNGISDTNDEQNDHIVEENGNDQFENDEPGCADEPFNAANSFTAPCWEYFIKTDGLHPRTYQKCTKVKCQVIITDNKKCLIA